MGKHYKLAFKLMVVQDYLESSLGCIRLARKYNISNESVVRRWVNQYKEFGVEGLARKLQNNTYTRDFKVSVLKFKQENKLSYRETANHFNISNPAMVVHWQHKFDEKGILGLDNKRKGRPSKMKSKNQNANMMYHL